MTVRKDFVGLHRVGLADAHEDEVVEDDFGRQRPAVAERWWRDDRMTNVELKLTLTGG